MTQIAPNTMPASPVSENRTTDELHSLTVKELHETLKLRGVEMSYSSLSELLNTDDIANQLRIEGGGNARRILPDVVDILAVFLPRYRAAKARLPQAATMLRAFLGSSAEPQNSETVAMTATQALAQLPAMGTQALDLGAEVVTLLRQMVSQAAPPDDRLLTLQEAHKEFGVPVPLLRGLRVKVGHRYKIRRSDVLRLIARL